MKPKTQAVLEMCIDAGLSSTVYGCDVELTTAQMQRIIDKAQREIWLQLDTYFDFE
jgi:hypothetical protein